MKFCTTCGAPLKEGASFCTTCGAPVNPLRNQEPRNAAQSEASDYDTPIYDRPIPEAPQPDSYRQQSYSYQSDPYSSPRPEPQPKAKTGIFRIYKKAFAVLLRKPFRLWGISLLSGFISGGLTLLFGFAVGIGICLDILITVGMTMVYLHGYRGEEVHAIQIFDAFKDWATLKRVLGGMAWMKMWVFLWALIPFAGPVFAVIRTYQYRLTPYILVTEPNIPATEAMNVSRQRTTGWKAKMFWADVLVYATLFVGFVVLSVFSQIPYIGVLFGFVFFLVSLFVSLFLNLFRGLVQSAFYEEISESL